MPTGTTDFNQPLATDPTSPGQSVAQTSGRLLMGGGSNSASGRWIWASGFEDGLAEWYPFSSGGAGGGGTIESGQPTGGLVYQGKKAGLATTPAVLNASAGFNKFLFAQGSRYGLEAMVRDPATIAGATEIVFSINGPMANGTQVSIVSIVIKHDFTGSSGIYTRVNTTDVLIANITNYMKIADYAYFHYVKIVGDTKENKFVRVYFDDLSFDLGSAPAYAINNTSKNLVFSISIITKTAASKTLLIDNVVITADEP